MHLHFNHVLILQTTLPHSIKRPSYEYSDVQIFHRFSYIFRSLAGLPRRLVSNQLKDQQVEEMDD